MDLSTDDAEVATLCEKGGFTGNELPILLALDRHQPAFAGRYECAGAKDRAGMYLTCEQVMVEAHDIPLRHQAHRHGNFLSHHWVFLDG